MARARNIKPGFFTNEELVELPFSTRLLFIGLWTVADREGRLEDKPKRIKMHLFPADEINVDEALDALQASGFLARYEVDGERFIQVLAFRKHQNPHRDEKASLIPPMGGHSVSTVQAPESNGGNPADSPIPDPLTLNPETLTTTDACAPAAGGGDGQPDDLDPPKAAPLPPANPALALTLVLRPLGVNVMSTNPIVIGWADRGVSVELLAEAVRIAREHKGDAPIPPQYLVPIVDRLLNPVERRSAPRQAGGPALNDKFHFAHQDRSGDRAAMEASMKRHGITLPGPDEEIEI